MPDWSSIIFGKGSQAAPMSQYSFAWRLSGDRAVAPLQVFDNGRRTWLQFAPQQALPAVFEHSATGDRPLAYTREGPYMLLDGVWPKLVLRGGHLKSLVERVSEAAPEPVATLPEAATITSEPAAPVSALMPDTVLPEASTASTPVAPLAAKLTAASFEHGLETEGSAELPQRYVVSPQDQNLRSALARWAQSAGWTFEPEHWAVDADIPIVGSAAFEPGFKFAVQELMASTELADRPLQPCFYSNRVLRIVPYAQQCDRTVSGSGAS